MRLDMPVAQGNTADIYMRSGKIIKLFKAYLPASEAKYEAEKQLFARGYGLAVPDIKEVTVINGRPAIVMDYVPGCTAGDLINEDSGLSEYYMGLSVKVQREIHAVSAYGLEPMRDRLARQITSALRINERQRGALLNKLQLLSYDTALCHGDFHVYNLIMTPEKTMTIIDWADAGDAEADVRRSYLLYMGVSPETAEMYLRLYCEQSGLSQAAVLEWLPVIAAARLSENVTGEKSERLLAVVSLFCAYRRFVLKRAESEPKIAML